MWIHVDESLPGDDEWVLVVVQTGDRRDVGLGKAVAKQSRIGYDSTDMVPRVTHWQRMPGLPEEVTP